MRAKRAIQMWLIGLLALWPSTAVCGGVAAGAYRAAEGPDVASRLLLRQDGRFFYILSAGALDERGEGRWVKRGDDVVLESDPRPVPPVFVIDKTDKDAGAAFSLKVVWPNGEGVAGVDCRLGLAGGGIVEGYTQWNGWRLEPGSSIEPVWIELHEPIHGTRSPRFDLPEQTNAMQVRLIPNDLGVVNFDGSRVYEEGGRLILDHPRGKIRYVHDVEVK